MSVEAMAVVLHHSLAAGTEKVVMIGVANHDGDGGAYPSVATLAKYARVTERTVQRAINHLQLPKGEHCAPSCCPKPKPGLGELRVELQQGGDRDTPEHLRANLYKILVRCPDDCDGTTQHRSKSYPQGRGRKARDRVTQMSPGDIDVTPSGDTVVTPPGDIDVTQTIPTNRPHNRPSPRSSASVTGPRARELEQSNQHAAAARTEIARQRRAAQASRSAS